MSGIGIITNPHSKLNRRNPSRAALLGFILGAQGQLEVTNTLADLGRVARDFKEKGIRILAINGGDGTISRTLTAFIREYKDQPLPRIALLRGGTINVLANNLGIRGSPEQVLFRLVEGHSGLGDLPWRRLRSLKIEGNYGFLFADGLAPAFLKEYYRRKSGPLGALALAVKVWGSRLFNGELFARVVSDLHHTLTPDVGPAHSHLSCAVFCSTVSKLPLGYPLFHLLSNEESGFQCSSFTMSAKDVLWQLPVILATRQDGIGKGKISFCCRELLVEQERPFDYTLDGELYLSRSNSLRIEMGPDLDFLTL
jgi:hypothetical protein